MLISFEGATFYRALNEAASFNALIDAISILISLTLIVFIHRWLKAEFLCILWVSKLIIQVTIYLVHDSYLYGNFDLLTLVNVLILYKCLNVQTLLYDVEDSREKLDRFFSYNFLFFEDD